MPPLQGGFRVFIVLAPDVSTPPGSLGAQSPGRGRAGRSRLRNPGDHGRRIPAGPGRQGSAVVGRAGGLAGQAGLATAVLALVGPDREPARGLLELAPGETGQRLPLKGELFGRSLHDVFLSRYPSGLCALGYILEGARWLAERAWTPGAGGFSGVRPPLLLHRFDFRQPFARASASVQNQASPRSGEMTVLS